MCCFSGPVVGVQLTGIFARASSGNGQYLAYQMRYLALSELAMILPLPTPAGCADDSVRFIDLSGYPEFFQHAERGFPSAVRNPGEIGDLSASDRLKVHDVGRYEASFVPRIPDFARLDARFRMPEGVWERLPQYADWSFAVFKLKEGNNKVHPMAFEFPRRDPAHLFFPTVHVHNRRVYDEAPFDHQLYCQALRPPAGWRKSAHVPRSWTEWQDADDHRKPPTPYAERLKRFDAAMEREPALPAGAFMETDKAMGLVDPGAALYLLELHGRLPNVDHYA